MYLPQPNESNYSPPPSGSHVAVCYQFIDLGTHLVDFQGTKNLRRKVVIGWELSHELMETGEYAGRPYRASKRYTWSMSDKATLRKDLESWRGRKFEQADFVGEKAFDTKNILGKACMLNIVHDTKDGNTYANVSSVSGLPKGMAVPAHVNDLVYFSLAPDRFDPAVLAGLSEKMQQMIKGTPEYAELTTGAKPASIGSTPHDLDDEVPF